MPTKFPPPPPPNAAFSSLISKSLKDKSVVKAETLFVSIGDLSYCDRLGALSYYY